MKLVRIALLASLGIGALYGMHNPHNYTAPTSRELLDMCNAIALKKKGALPEGPLTLLMPFRATASVIKHNKHLLATRSAQAAISKVVFSFKTKLITQLQAVARYLSDDTLSAYAWNLERTLTLPIINKALEPYLDHKVVHPDALCTVAYITGLLVNLVNAHEDFTAYIETLVEKYPVYGPLEQLLLAYTFVHETQGTQGSYTIVTEAKANIRTKKADTLSNVEVASSNTAVEVEKLTDSTLADEPLAFAFGEQPLKPVAASNEQMSMSPEVEIVMQEQQKLTDSNTSDTAMLITAAPLVENAAPALALSKPVLTHDSLQQRIDTVKILTYLKRAGITNVQEYISFFEHIAPDQVRALRNAFIAAEQPEYLTALGHFVTQSLKALAPHQQDNNYQLLVADTVQACTNAQKCGAILTASQLYTGLSPEAFTYAQKLIGLSSTQLELFTTYVQSHKDTLTHGTKDFLKTALWSDCLPEGYGRSLFFEALALGNQELIDDAIIQIATYVAQNTQAGRS